MSKKRKTFPQNIEEIISNGDMEQIKATFALCEPNAYQYPSNKQANALFLSAKMSKELIFWLVQEYGVDLYAKDNYGNSALHQQISFGNIEAVSALLELGLNPNGSENEYEPPLFVAVEKTNCPETVDLLIKAGANIFAQNDVGDTPLIYTLKNSLWDCLDVVKLLLAAGGKITPEMRPYIEQIGQEYEWRKDNIAPESQIWAAQNMQELYQLFNVTPVAPRHLHDGKSEIVVPDNADDAFNQLWEYLVPSSGQAITVQGEVIRIAGRVSDEIFCNGGINWDKHYQVMLDCWLNWLQSGQALNNETLSHAKWVYQQLYYGNGNGNDEALAQIKSISITWLKQNTNPVILENIPYNR